MLTGGPTSSLECRVPPRHARPIPISGLLRALVLICGLTSTGALAVAQGNQKPPGGVQPQICVNPCSGGGDKVCVSGGGSVTWSENTTGHKATFTATSCGTLSALWNNTCTAGGSVVCNSVSPSVCQEIPGRSCNVTVTYSVGAVGSGGVTMTSTTTDNNSQSQGTYTVTVAAGPSESAVTTYHYDTYRTGWNQHEQTLTPTNVVPGSFGLLYTISLDDQVDAQPLFVPHVMVNTGPYAGTTHDIVYVATENNTIYAIEPATGRVVFSRHLEAPDPDAQNCPDGPVNIGITGTPVLDSATSTLYG